MGERQTIVIAGGGIAGLTAALAIAAAGYHVIICERADKLSEIGAGIQISPNAGRVLAGLGLDKAMTRAAIEPRSLDISSGETGNLITSIPAAAFRDRYGFPYRLIHRADLQSILAKAVDLTPQIELILGANILGVLPRSDGLLVRIHTAARRDEVVPAAALIAADGVRSSLRETIDGSRAAKPTGRTAWRAIVAADVAGDLVATDRTGLWLGTNAHLVHYPVAQGAAVNLVAIVEEDWDKPGWSAPGDPEQLGWHFVDWGTGVRALLDAPVAWQKFALLVVEPGGAWVQDRLAVIGDAAHAMEPYLAQGAAMAIEDAAVLAALLYGATDIPAALRAYEATRKPRVTQVWNAARQTGERYHYAGTMASLRDVALRVLGTRLLLGQYGWIYGWQPAPRTAAGRSL
jgi:2-polyprenyl-6-methoxyphenol hydroxylase-like FAD-dependent oxidoreductase